MRQQFPLAIYQLDKVLLPLQLFGTKSPSSSPSPKASETRNTTVKGDAPSPSKSSLKDNGVAGKNVGFGFVVGLCVICMRVLF